MFECFIDNKIITGYFVEYEITFEVILHVAEIKLELAIGNTLRTFLGTNDRPSGNRKIVFDWISEMKEIFETSDLNLAHEM